MKIAGFGQDVSDPPHVGDRRISVFQCPIGIPEALGSLFIDIVGDGHSVVVEHGLVGDLDHVRIHHRPLISYARHEQRPL